MRAQTTLEYLMIIAITLGIILPTTYVFFRYSSESNTQILDSQINKIGRSIIASAETVYYSGDDSKVTLTVDIPENVGDMYIINNRELVFEVRTDIGQTESVFFSPVSITNKDGCLSTVCPLTELAKFGAQSLTLQSVNMGSDVMIKKAD